MSDRVACPVHFLEGVPRSGDVANAFRIMLSPTGDVMLDFCAYSEVANEAHIIARVCVDQAFLPLMGVRVTEAMAEIASTVGFREGFVICPDVKGIH